ncbi:hypothetical protein YWIDRAFT_07416 [Streptomyces sp. SceaMP-e96]|uniref:hypothetical protein n=1 Tax=Streptomyces TaxID=1883 RepID=UPI000823EC00|nr:MULTISPECIES: hypothetical protein [unclassified Streptomyces]MYT17782.1 hypothetical protein [Streptomyces sp. SID4951]SCK46855.1 hypothetical protein YWIDRAFT_07416 [Streptomyces sp. SceaMP-e96]
MTGGFYFLGNTFSLVWNPAKLPATLAVTQLDGRTSPAVAGDRSGGPISFIPLLLFFALAQRAMVCGINSGVGESEQLLGRRRTDGKEKHENQSD